MKYYWKKNYSNWSIFLDIYMLLRFRTLKMFLYRKYINLELSVTTYGKQERKD
jgi:hypothetical protein